MRAPAGQAITLPLGLPRGVQKLGHAPGSRQFAAGSRLCTARADAALRRSRFRKPLLYPLSYGGLAERSAARRAVKAEWSLRFGAERLPQDARVSQRVAAGLRPVRTPELRPRYALVAG